MATLYETIFFDYKALSDILKYQAKFYDNILTQIRPEPEYFRVGFYGLSFPLFVRVMKIMNKLFENLINNIKIVCFRINNLYIEA